MSWIDQGRQWHGWFGHGTAAGVASSEFKARAFAIVNFAASDIPSRDKSAFPLDKTTEVLRNFASVMAADAGLAPNDFRLRFFRASFDPVDAWTIQTVMRDIAAADTHSELVRSGQDLATTIEAHGPAEWTRLLDTAVAQLAPAPPAAMASGEAKVELAKYSIPRGPFPLPLPLPPVVIPGTRENRALTDSTIQGIRKLGSAIGGLFESKPRDPEEDEDENRRRRPPGVRPKSPEPAGAAGQEGETRDKPPPGSKPIDQTQWSGDHQEIKRGIGAKGADDVRISPDGDVWAKKPDGSWTNHNAAGAYTESGTPSGRTGAERDSRPER